MKQETGDMLIRTGIGAAGAATSWSLQDVNTVMAIAAGAVTTIYVLVNLAFLVRRWYKLEVSNWTMQHKE